MPTYKVSCQYMVWASDTVTVEAENPEHASEVAQEQLQNEVGAENVIIGSIEQ